MSCGAVGADLPPARGARRAGGSASIGSRGVGENLADVGDVVHRHADRRELDILPERLQHPPIRMTDESGSGGVGAWTADRDEHAATTATPCPGGGASMVSIARSALPKSATAGSHISPPVRRARRSNDERSCPTVDPTSAVAACITSSTDARRRAFGWSKRQSAPSVATNRCTTSEASDVASPDPIARTMSSA